MPKMKSYVLLYENGKCSKVEEFTNPADASATLEALLAKIAGDKTKNAMLVEALSREDLFSDPSHRPGGTLESDDGMMTDIDDYS